jgi:hypothetical protein
VLTISDYLREPGKGRTSLRIHEEEEQPNDYAEDILVAMEEVR